MSYGRDFRSRATIALSLESLRSTGILSFYSPLWKRRFSERLASSRPSRDWNQTRLLRCEIFCSIKKNGSRACAQSKRPDFFFIQAAVEIQNVPFQVAVCHVPKAKRRRFKGPYHSESDNSIFYYADVGGESERASSFSCSSPRKVRLQFKRKLGHYRWRLDLVFGASGCKLSGAAFK